MKIAILSPSKQVVGGVERFCSYLEKVYIEAGFEVEVISGDKSGAYQFFSRLGLGAPYLGWKIGENIRDINYDIIITNGSLGWNIRNRKIINVQHGTYAASADRIDKGNNLLKWFVKKYIWGYFEGLSARRASILVAVSEETAGFVKRYYCLKDVKMIANSVDFNLFQKRDKLASRDRFSLPRDRKLALFVGRFEYGKGSDIIEDCLGDLEKSGYSLVVASDKKLEIPGLISLVNVDYHNLPFLYSACDLFIFPTRHEGCSLALMEAMACEVPFFATKVGSVGEIIRADRSLESWSSNLQDFKKDLISHLSNKAIPNENERKLCQELFSYEKFKESHLSLIDSLKG